MAVTLHDMLNNLYGVKSTQRINYETNVVNLTPTRILNNNPNRLSFIFVNLSVSNMYISTSNNVSLTSGIFVAANGGSVVMQWDRDFELCSQEWYGISAGAGNNVYILENISV